MEIQISCEINFIGNVVWQISSMQLLNHAVTEPGFTFNNYFIVKPINFYSKGKIIEYNLWFVFCYVFRMSIT